MPPSSRPDSIYELFTALGLDASGLDAGLAKADVKLKTFQKNLDMMAEQTKATMSQAEVSVRALSIALDQLQAKGLGPSQAIAKLKMGMEALYQPPRQIQSLGRSDVVEEAQANAERKRVRAVEIADERAHIALKKQQATQLAAAERAKEAELDRAFQYEMRQREARRLQRKAEMANESMLNRAELAAKRQADVERFGGGVSRGGIGAEIRSSFYLGGALQALGVKVPMGLTSVLGRLEQVQLAAAAAFNVLAIGAFVTIVVELGRQLRTVWDNFRGLDEASRATWEAASRGVEATVLKTIEFKNQLREINEAGLKGKELRLEQGKNAASSSDDIRALIETHRQVLSEATAAKEALRKGAPTPQSLATGLPIDPVLLARFNLVNELVRSHGDLAKANDAVNATYETELKILEQLNLKLGQTTMEEKRRKLEFDRTKEKEANDNKRRRDRVHELPWRLPWFMGPNPAQFFLDQLAGAPARAPFFKGGGRGPKGERVGEASEVGPPRMQRAGTQASIQIINEYKPTFAFNGVPADHKKYAREHMAPVLMEDWRNNQRGTTDDLMAVLKKNGVRTV